MGLNSFELGLRPQDSFEVIQDFYLNSQHLEILNRLFTPLIGPQAIGLYHFMHQFSNDLEQPLTHYVIISMTLCYLYFYIVKLIKKDTKY